VGQRLVETVVDRVILTSTFVFCSNQIHVKMLSFLYTSVHLIFTHFRSGIFETEKIKPTHIAQLLPLFYCNKVLFLKQ